MAETHAHESHEGGRTVPVGVGVPVTPAPVAPGGHPAQPYPTASKGGTTPKHYGAARDPKSGEKTGEETPPKVGDPGYTPERHEQDPWDGRGEEEAAAAVASTAKADSGHTKSK